jgi:hypothetical protein
VNLAEVLIVGTLAHFVGDYLIQSDWMSANKTAKWWPAIAHGLTYTLPFLLVTRNPVALLIIGGTHAVIDHYRLARYLVWAKNLLAPRSARVQWRYCTKTGYPDSRAPWMAVWLMVIADNTIHITINSLTLWGLR